MAPSFFLREQADRCRRLARGSNDVVTQERLLKLATEYDARADAQDAADWDATAQGR
jgi:hypothetical protein